MILRIAQRLRREDRGLSMTEITVAALLTALIMVMCGTFFVQVARVTTQSTQTRNSTASAANLVNAVTGPVRMSALVNSTTNPSSLELTPAIYAATGSSLTVFTLVDASATDNPPIPKKFAFAVDSATGVLTVTKCTLSMSGDLYIASTCNSPATRTIGSRIQNATTFFTYLDSSGAVIPLVGGSLPSSSYDDVAAIRVTANVRATGSVTNSVVIQNTVQMANLGSQGD